MFGTLVEWKQFVPVPALDHNRFPTKGFPQKGYPRQGQFPQALWHLYSSFCKFLLETTRSNALNGEIWPFHGYPFWVGFWQNGFFSFFFSDFCFWAVCHRIFYSFFCGKKCPEKSSRKIPSKNPPTFTQQKSPDTFLQRGRAKKSKNSIIIGTEGWNTRIMMDFCLVSSEFPWIIETPYTMRPVKKSPI